LGRQEVTLSTSTWEVSSWIAAEFSAISLRGSWFNSFDSDGRRDSTMIDYGQYNSINQNYTSVKSAKRDLITDRMWNCYLEDVFLAMWHTSLIVMFISYSINLLNSAKQHYITTNIVISFLKIMRNIFLIIYTFYST